MTYREPNRPRQMVSLAQISAYWANADETPKVLPGLMSEHIGWGEPFCFACGWMTPTPDGPNAWRNITLNGWLDRAHLVDHSLGGSGKASNLVPLCQFCHLAMPQMFGERSDALDWVNERESSMPEPHMWQLFTDTESSGRPASRSRMQRMRADYLERLLRNQARSDRLTMPSIHTTSGCPTLTLDLLADALHRLPDRLAWNRPALLHPVFVECEAPLRELGYSVAVGVHNDSAYLVARRRTLELTS
jgi:hypothetical protein